MHRVVIFASVVLSLALVVFARPAVAQQLVTVLDGTTPRAAAPFSDPHLAAIAIRPVDTFLSPAEQQARNDIIVVSRRISVPFALAARGIADVGLLAPNERHVRVRGHVLCDSAQPHAKVSVIVTQKATAALAEGQTRTDCGTTEQPWELQANAQGPNVFEPGTAHVCALAEIYQRGARIDLEHWCKDVLLMSE
jgi:hypothetical protein